MKNFLLLLLLLCSSLNYGQVNFSIKKIQVNNSTVSSINFGTNSTVNVAMEVEISTTNFQQQNLTGFFRIKTFSNSTTAYYGIPFTTGYLIPYNPFTDQIAKGTIYNIKFTLDKNEFENSGGYIICEWENMVFNISKSTKINVAKNGSSVPPTPQPSPSKITIENASWGNNRYFYLEGKLPQFVYNNNNTSGDITWKLAITGFDSDNCNGNNCGYVLPFGNNADLNNNSKDLRLNEYLELAGKVGNRMPNWSSYDNFTDPVYFTIKAEDQAGNSHTNTFIALYNPIRTNSITRVLGDVIYGYRNDLIYENMLTNVYYSLGGYKNLTSYYFNSQTSSINIEAVEARIDVNSIASFNSSVSSVGTLNYRWEYKEYNPIDIYSRKFNVTRGPDVTHDSSWQILGYGKDITDLQNKLDLSKKGYFIRRIAYFNYSISGGNVSQATIDSTSDIVLLLNDSLLVNKLCCDQKISSGQQLAVIQGNNPTTDELKNYISKEFVIEKNKIVSVGQPTYEWYIYDDYNRSRETIPYQKLNFNGYNYLPTVYPASYLRVMRIAYKFINKNNVEEQVITYINSNVINISRARGSAAKTNNSEVFEDLEKLSIYPNPVSDFLFIQNDAEIVDFSVYDLNGKKINLLLTKENSNLYKVDVRNLSSGTYILNINNKQNKFIKK